VSIGVFPEIDGRTRLAFGPAREVWLRREADFDDFVETPTKTLFVSTATGVVLVMGFIETEITRVRIWRSHPDWPTRVTIGYG